MTKRFLLFSFLLLVSLFIFIGCGRVIQDAASTSSDDTIPVPSEPTYINDGVTGGTFTSSDGDFSAIAPDGSIPAGLSVNPTVTEVSVDEDAALAEGETKVSNAYQLDLDSIDLFLTTSTVEVALAFDSTDIPAEKLTSQYVYANVYLPDTGDLLSISGTISGTTLTLNTKGLAKNAIYMVVYNPDTRIVYPSAAASSLIRAFETPTNWAASSSNWKVIYNPNHALLRTVVAGILNTTAASLSNEAIDSVVQERIADNAVISAARYEGAGFRQPNLTIDNTSAEGYYLIHLRTNGRGSSFSSTRPDENASFEGYVTGRLNIAPTRMDDAVGSNLGGITASIAHEMLHAIQLGYDIGTSTDSRPIKEGSAVPYGVAIDTYGANADQAATLPIIRPSPAQAQKLSNYLLYGMAGASKTPAYQHQDFFTWTAINYGSNSLGGWVPTLLEQIRTDLAADYAANNNANIFIQPSREAVLQSMNTAFVSAFGAGNTLGEVYFNFAKDRAMGHSTVLRTGEPAAGTLNADLFAAAAKKSVTVDDPETVPGTPVEETFANVAGYSSRVITFTPAQAKDDVTIGLTVTSTGAALGSTVRAALYRAGVTVGSELTSVRNLTDYGSSTDDVLIILLSNTSADPINITCRLGPPTDNTVEATVEISETNYDFAPRFIAGGYGSISGSINRSDLPTIVAYERTGAQVLNGDVLSIMTDPNTISSSGGTYAFNEDDEVFGDENNGSATLAYHTPLITHADDGTVVGFESIGGSITFTSYGSSLEAYLSGTFEATVAGSREILSSPSSEVDTRETLLGTITGNFGVTLGTSTEVSSAAN